MQIRFIALFILLTVFSTPISAQSNDPIIPKIGYWQSTTVNNHHCVDADGIIHSNMAQIGHQEIIPITINEDKNGLYIYNIALRRYQNGYHGNVFPDRPETVVDNYSVYGNLRIRNDEDMTLDLGAVNKQIFDENGNPCLYYTTYTLQYLGEERPTPPNGFFKAGYWTIKTTFADDAPDYCWESFETPFIINADGIPQYYHFYLSQTANGQYDISMENQGMPDFISITPTSDETFTGAYHISVCEATFTGQFEREFFTVSNYDDLGVNPDIRLESGLWNVFNTPRFTVLDGDPNCKPNTVYLNHVMQVSPDAEIIDFISNFGIWTLTRDETGLYRGAHRNIHPTPSYMVIEPVAPTSFNYYLEQTQDTCTVLQAGIGSWNGDVLSPYIEPIDADSLPPATLDNTPIVDCTISASGTVNLRTGAGTNFDRAGSLQAGESEKATAKSEPVGGLTWYRLERGAWVREDVVTVGADCEQLPIENS